MEFFGQQMNEYYQKLTECTIQRLLDQAQSPYGKIRPIGQRRLFHPGIRCNAACEAILADTEAKEHLHFQARRWTLENSPTGFHF
jgi:hypothetical protein